MLDNTTKMIAFRNKSNNMWDEPNAMIKNSSQDFELTGMLMLNSSKMIVDNNDVFWSPSL